MSRRRKPIDIASCTVPVSQFWANRFCMAKIRVTMAITKHIKNPFLASITYKIYSLIISY